MALTEEDRSEIARIIRSELNRGCVCGISADTQAKMGAFMGHFIGMAEDLGNGNQAKGIEIMREALKFIGRIRKRGEKIGGALFVFIFISAAGALLWILGLGAKMALRLWSASVP